MTDRFFISLLLFLLAQTVSADSRTLATLRADLASGSLQPVLARQALVPVPDRVVARWVQDVDIKQFAITGFNENRERFAARVRLLLLTVMWAFSAWRESLEPVIVSPSGTTTAAACN